MSSVVNAFVVEEYALFQSFGCTYSQKYVIGHTSLADITGLCLKLHLVLILEQHYTIKTYRLLKIKGTVGVCSSKQMLLCAVHLFWAPKGQTVGTWRDGGVCLSHH